MKDSHMKTPRCTEDGCWQLNSDPIERYHEPTSYQWPLAIVLVIILCVFGYHFYAASISALDEAVAVESAMVDAIEQAQADKRKQDALQMMCGGPESTPVALGGGMYDCVNKRGFKQMAK